MNTKRSNESLERPSLEVYQQLSKHPVYVILDCVRSAQNVGSIFRTMDAFGCQELMLCGITPTPPHRDINKTALGATASVGWSYWKNTIEAVRHVKKLGVEVYAVEQTTKSIDLARFHPPENQSLALVFGNEVSGVSQEVVDLCDGSIEIAQYGTKHSLNISVCTGIVLWHIAGRIPLPS